HTLTSPGAPPPLENTILQLARRLPSGLKATLETLPVCPLQVRSSWPVWASQTFTVLSSDVPARRLPSGLKATLQTLPLRERSSWPAWLSPTFPPPAAGGAPPRPPNPMALLARRLPSGL